MCWFLLGGLACNSSRFEKKQWLWSCEDHKEGKVYNFCRGKGSFHCYYTYYYRELSHQNIKKSSCPLFPLPTKGPPVLKRKKKTSKAHCLCGSVISIVWPPPSGPCVIHQVRVCCTSILPSALVPTLSSARSCRTDCFISGSGFCVWAQPASSGIPRLCQNTGEIVFISANSMWRWSYPGRLWSINDMDRTEQKQDVVISPFSPPRSCLSFRTIWERSPFSYGFITFLSA